MRDWGPPTVGFGQTANQFRNESRSGAENKHLTIFGDSVRLWTRFNTEQQFRKGVYKCFQVLWEWDTTCFLASVVVSP